MLGHAEAIGEDVVVPFGAERARKADAIDLERRRSEREDTFSGVERVAVAIDEDRDAILANAPGDGGHGLLTDVEVMLEGRLGPALKRIFVVGTQVVGKHLQPRSVDLLPELRR